MREKEEREERRYLFDSFYQQSSFTLPKLEDSSRDAIQEKWREGDMERGRREGGEKKEDTFLIATTSNPPLPFHKPLKTAPDMPQPRYSFTSSSSLGINKCFFVNDI